jgi:c(7)-type cytochrome triheme protein
MQLLGLLFTIIAFFFFFRIANVHSETSSAPDVIIIDKQGKSRSYSNTPPPVFTHGNHEKIFKCEACHPELFIPKIGANIINMRDNMNGKYCGRCHDGIKASGMANCEVCHKIP